VKILLLSPVAPDSIGGNAATLRRLSAALRARAVDVILQEPEADVPAQVRREGPDLVHAYHGWKTGRWLAGLRIPSVVTLSGTDLEADLAPALGAARVVLTYSPSIAARVPRARVIPKGVHLGTASCDLRALAGLPASSRVALLPGGIRAVKDPGLAAAGVASRPDLDLVLAGPILEPAVAAALPRLRRVEVPPDAMPSALRQADLVLNTSRSEGLSNALIEAMSVGAAVLAKDIPGNRDVIRDGVTGLLFTDLADFQAKLARLADDPGLRSRLGSAAAAEARERFSTDREVEAVLAAYGEALGRV
jgi:glycosyltransferase involved in cell wall biosynthesis